VKVAFDTNVLVSALTLRGGSGARAVGRIISGEDDLALSRPIIDELIGVLARKFGRDREQLARTAVFLASLAEIVEPDVELAVLSDAADNRVLECALMASAEIIVTGDRGMLALGSYESVRIVTLREYLQPGSS
jgi:putative PIN family toxin of toxin-antitoxin system